MPIPTIHHHFKRNSIAPAFRPEKRITHNANSTIHPHFKRSSIAPAFRPEKRITHNANSTIHHHFKRKFNSSGL
jgi:hypothetical protein